MSWQPMRRIPLNQALVEAHQQIGSSPPNEAWANDTYDCAVYRQENKSAVLSIKRRDREATHDWRHLQQIKNEVCGPEVEAVEIYPAESRLVDTANQYYLHVLPPGVRLPIGFQVGLVMTSEQNACLPGGAKQRPWEDGLTTGQHPDIQADVSDIERKLKPAMSIEETIARIKAETGYDAAENGIDRQVESKDGWRYGERVSYAGDHEMISPDAEGYLLIERVGAEEYGNERVAFFFLEDGCDTPEEIDASRDIETMP